MHHDDEKTLSDDEDRILKRLAEFKRTDFYFKTNPPEGESGQFIHASDIHTTRCFLKWTDRARAVGIAKFPEAREPQIGFTISEECCGIVTIYCLNDNESSKLFNIGLLK